jgi:GNAT superfamily N-acetyltransferase
MQRKSKSSVGDAEVQLNPTTSIERIYPNEIDTIARILAQGYASDPILQWGLPMVAEKPDDARLFFTFYLKRMWQDNLDVFATADRSAVVIIRLVRKGNRAYQDRSYKPTGLVRTKSPLNDFFQWIETFRPEVDHRYLEFICSLPTQHSKGIGSFLLGSRLTEANREGLPVWAWSSNPRNLPFYRRLGFEIGEELRKDAGTPPVTLIWHPVV